MVEEEITDEYMKRALDNAVRFTVVVLRSTPRRFEAGADKIVWEHGRRLFQLRKEGKLCVVCPVIESGDISGFCIFSAGKEETREIMNADPAVMAGIFEIGLYATSSFPGDSLHA